jgi:hypothetical protein
LSRYYVNNKWFSEILRLALNRRLLAAIGAGVGIAILAISIVMAMPTIGLASIPNPSELPKRITPIVTIQNDVELPACGEKTLGQIRDQANYDFMLPSTMVKDYKITHAHFRSETVILKYSDIEHCENGEEPAEYAPVDFWVSPYGVQIKSGQEMLDSATDPSFVKFRLPNGLLGLGLEGKSEDRIDGFTRQPSQIAIYDDDNKLAYNFSSFILFEDLKAISESLTK